MKTHQCILVCLLAVMLCACDATTHEARRMVKRDMSQLPAGTYTMRVTLKNGDLFGQGGEGVKIKIKQKFLA